MKQPITPPAKKSLKISALNSSPSMRDLVEADWAFVDPKEFKGGKYDCKSEEKGILFRYELARQAVRSLDEMKSSANRDTVTRRWADEFGLLEAIYPAYFPSTPYLAIPPIERRDRWRNAFSDKSGNVPLADDPYWFGYSCRWVNGYKETERVDQLIDRREIPEFPDPLGSGDGYPYLIDEENRNQVYDRHRVCARIDIDLRFEDPHIIEQFRQSLKCFRERGAIEPQYYFVAGTTLDEGLRWLALARLLVACKTVGMIHTYLGRRDIEAYGKTTVYECRKRVEEWLKNPPVVPRGKSSIRKAELPGTKPPQ